MHSSTGSLVITVKSRERERDGHFVWPLRNLHFKRTHEHACAHTLTKVDYRCFEIWHQNSTWLTGTKVGPSSEIHTALTRTLFKSSKQNAQGWRYLPSHCVHINPHKHTQIKSKVFPKDKHGPTSLTKYGQHIEFQKIMSKNCNNSTSHPSWSVKNYSDQTVLVPLKCNQEINKVWLLG
jgi:hypothetical protein